MLIQFKQKKEQLISNILTEILIISRINKKQFWKIYEYYKV